MSKAQHILVHTILLAGALLVCFPFIWMVLTSLKHGSEVLETGQWLPLPRTFIEQDQEYGPPKPVEVEVLSEMANFTEVKVLEGRDRNTRIKIEPDRLVHERWHVGNYGSAWNKGGGTGQATFGWYFFNSFLVAVITTLGNVVTSVLAAFALTFFEFSGKGMLFTIMLMTMMVPQQVLLIPDYLLVNHLGWINSYPALIVPWCAGVFGIFLLRQFFMTFPRDLYEAATLDGCSRVGFLFRIVIPLSMPPILTISIFTFLASWNALIWPLVVATRDDYFTIQVGLASFVTEAGTRWELLMAASAISIIPLILLYFIAQRHFIEGIATSGLKG